MLFLIISLIFSMEKSYVEKDNKIIVKENDIISGDFSVIGRDLEIFGYVGGDVAVVGGNLKIKGSVGGDVAVVGGDCVILKGGVISGDLAVVGGKIKKEEGAKILGEATVVNLGPLTSPLRLLKFLGKGVHVEEGEKEEITEKDTLRTDTTRIEEKSEVEEITEEKPSVFLTLIKEFIPPLLFIVIFFLFVFLVNIVFPGAVKNMEQELSLSPWQILGTGFLIQIVYIPVIFILIISILGIPLAFAIILSSPLFLIYGSTPVLNLFGRTVLNRLKIEYKNEHIPLLASFLYFSILILITKVLFYFDVDNIFYVFVKFFLFSISFLSFYVVFTIAAGVILFAKLGIKKTE